LTRFTGEKHMPAIDVREAMASWRRAFQEARDAQARWLRARYRERPEKVELLRKEARDTQRVATEMLNTALLLSEEEVHEHFALLHRFMDPLNASMMQSSTGMVRSPAPDAKGDV
jgi:hypothetical protein